MSGREEHGPVGGGHEGGELPPGAVGEDRPVASRPEEEVPGRQGGTTPEHHGGVASGLEAVEEAHRADPGG